MQAVGTQHIVGDASRAIIWSDFWLGLTVVLATTVGGAMLLRLLI